MFKTNEEYLAAIQRYFNYMRNNDEVDYTPSNPADCRFVDCIKCIYYNSGVCPEDNTFETLEKLAKWAEEHPIITYADKYKEIFGIDASQKCPENLLGVKCPSKSTLCSACRQKYWNAEYKKPADRNNDLTF